MAAVPLRRLREVELALSADLTRGLAPQEPWMLMENATSAVNWQPRNLAKTPGQLRCHALSHVAERRRNAPPGVEVVRRGDRLFVLDHTDADVTVARTAVEAGGAAVVVAGS